MDEAEEEEIFRRRGWSGHKEGDGGWRRRAVTSYCRLKGGKCIG